jgi:hypothetical protein
MSWNFSRGLEKSKSSVVQRARIADGRLGPAMIREQMWRLHVRRRNLRASVWWVRVEGGMRMIAARCALRGEKLVGLWEDCWVHGAFGLS